MEFSWNISCPTFYPHKNLSWPNQTWKGSNLFLNYQKQWNIFRKKWLIKKNILFCKILKLLISMLEYLPKTGTPAGTVLPSTTFHVRPSDRTWKQMYPGQSKINLNTKLIRLHSKPAILCERNC